MPCPFMDHVVAPARRPPFELRIVATGVLHPVRIVSFFQEATAEDGHELHKLQVNSGAMQAFVIVLPENLPVALHRLDEGMAEP